MLQDPETPTPEPVEAAEPVVPLTDRMVDFKDWLREDGIEWLKTDGVGLAVQWITAVAIFVIGRWLARWVTSLVERLLARRKFDPTLIGFVTSMVYLLLLTFVAIAALNQAGINTTGVAAVIAAASFAIGFALQGSLSNFAAGVMMMIFRPIGRGDFIEAAGTSGVVEDIGVFATILKTGDNKRIIVPNSGITGGNIVNYSANPTRRIDLTFGIGYGDDLKRAKAVLEEICSAEPRVLADPATTVAVSELGDNAVVLVCRPWVASGDYWPTRFDLIERVKERFDAEGIEFPFPQRSVHLNQVS